MTEPLGVDAQAIRRRAHELWLQRGCPTGTPELDWQEAEHQLRAEVAGAEPAGTTRAIVENGQAISPGNESVPQVPRPRAPRSIVTRSGHAPAARLLVALVRDASPEHAAAQRDRASRR